MLLPSAILTCLRRSLAIAFFLTVLTTPVLAEDSGNIIITAGPSWKNFTNQDGSGLYHDIIKLVFADFSIQHIYASSDQANELVAVGRADIKLCETNFEPPLLLAKQPMYENAFYTLYLKERIGNWRGVETLAGKKLVWREGYYSQVDFPVEIISNPVRSGESALMMVILGRADFYVDDMALIKQTFAAAEEDLDLNRFGIKMIGSRKYYPVFSDTERGRKLRDYYQREFKRLYREGALQQIYQRWNFPMPKINFK